MVRKKGNRYEVVFDDNIVKSFSYNIRDERSAKLAKKKAYRMDADLAIKRAM